MVLKASAQEMGPNSLEPLSTVLCILVRADVFVDSIEILSSPYHQGQMNPSFHYEIV
ncbi:hypothetical protein FOPG_17417 [Fusarium oxysporum f. sp. conglutinans race 2 54008]|uniref:Uncharacterized protein n=1 Tax=Fusarium oxysporum f. sp. conglutinans race 2 54008 TaxID=1089457 RepID=X0GST6_FUSOX|nr:hypothetical protein FOPG_17417 [Fusarium oxysporum f. sp. conglutinans race 2 54008]